MAGEVSCAKDDDGFKIDTDELQRKNEESKFLSNYEFKRGKRDKWAKVEVNIAVTGDSGAGKSSFINAIRELDEDDQGAAPVDITQCTKEPTPYNHPSNPNIKFWDLPGIGTPNYPNLQAYIEKVQLEKYHAFLIFTATRFTENNLQLAVKIRSMQKKFLFIRTKIDDSTRAESRKRSFDEQEMLSKIRCKCLANLGDLLDNERDVFLISNHQPEKWDFARLTQAIFDAVMGLYEQESLTLSLHNLTIRS